MGTNGLDNVLMNYVHCLEDNSKIIENILTQLSEKKLSPQEKKKIRSIGREIEQTNKSINNIGKNGK